MTAAREMTLAEWVDTLPKPHGAREEHALLLAEVARLRGERDAYCRAKQENDERFMLERDQARADLARVTAERDEARGKLWRAELAIATNAPPRAEAERGEGE